MATVVTIVAYQLPDGDCNWLHQPGAVTHDGDVIPLTPGAIVALQNGTYSRLDIQDVDGGYPNGSLHNPIVFTNIGGQVLIEPDGVQDINLRRNQGIEIDGSGHGPTPYGFLCQQRVHSYDDSTGLTIHDIRCDIRRDTQAIMVKNEGGGDRESNDLEIYDCDVITSVAQSASAFYIGKSDGTIPMRRINIHHNTIDGTGEGIQLSGTEEDCTVHHNVIRDINQDQPGTLAGCITLNPGSGDVNPVLVYNNDMEDSEGYGIYVDAACGGAEIYNNRIVNTGHTKATAPDAIDVDTHDTVEVSYNTIVTAGGYGLDVCGGCPNVEAWCNIILACGTGSIDQGGSPGGNFYDNDTQEEGHTPDNYDFVNPVTRDYHILVTSPAVGAGVAPAPTDDLDDVVRGEPADLGCYEYVP